MTINPRTSLYLFLTDKLSGLITDDTIKVVDRWNNQIENEKTSAASVLPAVHIQIENRFESPTANFELQKGDVIITCHIDINVSANEGIGTQDWDIAHAVYIALAGEKPDDTDDTTWTPLERTDEVEDNEYSGRYHGKVVFETYLSDCTKGTENVDDGQTGTIDTLNITVNRVDEI